MIKAIFVDIDGTLLSHRAGGVPQSAQRSLKALQKKGILVFAATGRHVVEMEKLPLQGVDFDGYVVLNGQLVLDKNGNAVGGNPLDENARQAIGRIFTECRIPVLLMEQQRDYINFVNPLVERVQAQISTEIPQVGCYEGGAIYQASIYLEPGQEALLQACLPESVRTVHWNSDGVDVIPSTGGKNEGIKMMMRHHGLCREEVMAIGDGDNDEQMVRFAGIGVCMGNGVEKTKQVADYVTDHIDNDGLEKAFAHFGLL